VERLHGVCRRNLRWPMIGRWFLAPSRRNGFWSTRAPTRRGSAASSGPTTRGRAESAHEPIGACDGVFRHWQENESAADVDKSVDAIRGHLRPEASRSDSRWLGVDLQRQSRQRLRSRLSLRFRHGGHAQAGPRFQGLANERAQNSGVLSFWGPFQDIRSSGPQLV